MHKALHNKVYLKIAFSLCYRFGIQLHTKYQFSCYNPIKILFLTVVIVPVKIFFTSYSLYTQVMVTVILIDVQYLLNVAFSFENGSNGSHHSVKKSPSKIPHSPTGGIPTTS